MKINLIENYLAESISLLNEIKNSPSLLAWCRNYSVYNTQPDLGDLNTRIRRFGEGAYDNGLVVTNYVDVLGRLNKSDEVSLAQPQWIKSLSEEELLASIAWHFRRDHFIEGSLISESIADGPMLRLYTQLRWLKTR